MNDWHRLRIEPMGKEILMKPEETILESLSRGFFGQEGEPIFMGCRRGGCSSCKMELLSGSVVHAETYSRTALTEEERDRNRILACMSKPLSSITIRRVRKENPWSVFFQKDEKKGEQVANRGENPKIDLWGTE